jgi:type I restriction enzyme S subunit
LNNYFSVAKAKTGNTFANMNKADFEEINVVYPPIDVLKSFQDKVSNQFNLIKNQSKQNGELTKLRDWLLPMLMNGQVTVQ